MKTSRRWADELRQLGADHVVLPLSLLQGLLPLDSGKCARD
jgi:hypothetical protein